MYRTNQLSCAYESRVGALIGPASVRSLKVGIGRLSVHVTGPVTVPEVSHGFDQCDSKSFDR